MAADNENMSFDDMWEDASKRFEQLTDKKLKPDPGISFEDCIKKVEAAQLQEQDGGKHFKPGKRKNVKTYGLNTLRFLKLLGGVVAEGVGMVFAPSKVCFNAFAILLEFPEKANNLWEAVDNLFETLSSTLGEFQIYSEMDQFEQVGRQLKQVIHKLMISFVDICALSVKLQHSGKWDKVMATMKHGFCNDDSGLKKEIENFQKLANDHDRTKTTLTLKKVLETRGDIIQLLDDACETGRKVSTILDKIRKSDDERNATEERLKQLETIKGKFSLGNQVKKSNDIGQALSTQRIPCSAEWFENQIKHPGYSKWADSKNPDGEPILLVTGDQNTGKSILLSSIARSLRSADKTANSSSARVLVSAYFFQDFTGKEDQEKRPIETAIKCIAYLMAEQDEIYSKNLFQILEGPEAEKHLNNATVRSLWRFLEIGSAKRRSTHYIIFDGIEGLSIPFSEAKEEFFDTVASSMSQPPDPPSHLRPRVAISARSIPSAISHRDFQGLASTINIQEHSGEDMQRFVARELKDKDLFQDNDDDSEMMRMNIRHKLVEKVKGNFTIAKTSIERITRVVEADDPNAESEIEWILYDSIKDEETISGTVIKKLQESLSAAEVKELNELLLWVIYGYKQFTVNELEAALYLGGKRRWWMLRLVKKLQGKYAPIIKLDEGGHVKIDEDMTKAITKPRTLQRRVDDSAKFSATITITQGDLSQVQTFLWSLAHKFNVENLGFEQLGSRTDVKGTIEVNSDNGHLAIVRSTFMLLANDPSERSRAIAEYLLRFLPRHLEELEKAKDNDALTDAEKTEIGSGIYNMVFSKVLDKHWEICGDVSWYGVAKDVAVFRRWLADRTATRKLGAGDHEWLEKVEHEENPNQALLERIMKSIAWRWLRNDEHQALKPFSWLQGYLAMPKTLKSQGKGPGGDHTGEPSPAQLEQPSIEYVAEWCAVALGVGTKDALWHQRLGETYRMLGRNDDGVKAFNTALEHGGSENLCFEGLAHCFAGSKKLDEACKQMEKALKIAQKEEEANQRKIVSTYLTLADWYKQLEDHERVAEYISKVMERPPEDTDLQFDALRICLESKQDSQASRILDGLLGIRDAQVPPSPSLWKVLLHMSAERDTKRRDKLFLRCFGLLKEDMKALEGFLHAMDDSLNHRGTQTHAGALLLYKGIGLYYFGHEHESARFTWRQCLDKRAELGHTVEWDQAAMLLSAAHFEYTRESAQTDHRPPVEGMRWLVDMDGSLNISAPRTYLASYYMFKESQPAAEEVLRDMIHSAFYLLSDDIDYNDNNAYHKLGCALAQLGDKINALTAFSLRLPSSANFDALAQLLEFEQESTKSLWASVTASIREHAPRHGPLHWQIQLALLLLNEQRPELTAESDPTGDFNDDKRKIREELNKWSGKRYWRSATGCNNCEKQLGSDVDFYHCRYCHDMDVCEDCFQRLRNGELLSGRLISLTCKQSHDWLRLPKWNRTNFLRSLRSHVIKGGSIGNDGHRLGGEEVPAQVWLDGLKRDWGFVDNSDEEASVNEEIHMSKDK